MSLQFSDTSRNKKGIIQQIERELGYDYGYITSNSTLFAEVTVEVNLAHDDLFYIGFRNSGTWQLDDTNYVTDDGDYPIIRRNIVSGRRDYTFLEDEYGNLILDFHKVTVADQNGIFREITPVDQQSPNSNQFNVDSLIDGRDTTGTPTRYDKTANGIFLDLIPNYNYTNGLVVYINREGSYFDIDDTTKKPGIPGLLHRYYVIKPAMVLAGRNQMNDRYAKLADEVFKYEGDETRGIMGKIARTFAGREKDKIKRMWANVEDCH